MNMKLLCPMLISSAAARSARSLRDAVAFQRHHRPPLRSTSTAPVSPLRASSPELAQGGAADTAATLEYTPLPSIAPLVAEARRSYASRLTHPYQFRVDQLRGIEALLRENADDLVAALGRDLGQGALYAEAFELTHVRAHARHARGELRGWMAARRAPTPFPINLNAPVRSELAPGPRGVALLLSPWNLPLQMIFNPLIDALAAGNVCVLKLSERSAHSTALCTALLTSGAYVDPRAVRVVNGGPAEATELLKQKVDVIMYTGGETVGRIVARAAAEQLTPVLLELGGKNPVFVTARAHLPSAALRIAWGKITGNAGQMCLCPDYVLVEESVKEEFTEELCKAMDQMYPPPTYSNGDVGKMISVQHAQRVVNLLDSTCNVIYGGEHDVKERFVAPTVVEATADSTIMKEEIFGPLLALVTVPSVDAGIEFVNRHFTRKGRHPLALYIFSKSQDERRRIMEAVPSGTCAINEVLKQSANVHLPFGGRGTSGMGSYHGKFGFDFFSHYRGTLVGNNYSTWKWDPSVWLTYPPYDARKLFFFRALGRVPVAAEAARRLLPLAKAALPVGFAILCWFNPDAILELNLKTILKWLSQTLSR